MGKVFNPPPNWPAPPTGWAPPPGWTPDPAWGPPPAGWELWSRANPAAFTRTLIIGGAVYGVVLVALSMTGNLSAYVGGYVLTIILLPAIVVAFIARSSSKRWSWPRYVVIVLGAELLTFAVNAVQALSRSRA